MFVRYENKLINLDKIKLIQYWNKESGILFDGILLNLSEYVDVDGMEALAEELLDAIHKGLESGYRVVDLDYILINYLNIKA